jgi:hypothetical protein
MADPTLNRRLFTHGPVQGNPYVDYRNPTPKEQEEAKKPLSGIPELLTDWLVQERKPPMQAVTDWLLNDPEPYEEPSDYVRIPLDVQRNLLKRSLPLVDEVETPRGKSSAEMAKEYMQTVAQDSSPTNLFPGSTAAPATTPTAPDRIPTGAAPAAPSGPPRPTRPDLSDFYEQQTFDEFANQFGLDPRAKAYDPWAYIRDMSAGLLASNNPRFLGALGDAALLSNKNRAAMDAAQKDLQAKLAIAKYGSDQKWKQKAFDAEVDMYEADMDALADGPGMGWKTGDVYDTYTGADGLERKISIVTEGWQNVPEHMRHYLPNGQVGVIALKHDEAKQLDKMQGDLQKAYNEVSAQIIKPDNMKAEIDSWLRQTTAGGEFVLSLKNIDGYNDIVETLMDSSEDAAIELGEMLSEGNPDAAEVARALTQLPQVFQQFKRLAESGPAANLEDAAYAAIRQRANQLAKLKLMDQALNTPSNERFIYDAPGTITSALQEATQEINWDADNFQFKFRGQGATTDQLKSAQSASEDMRGIGWFNLRDAPVGYTKGYAPFHNPGEIALFNLDQIELANPEVANEAYIDMAKIHDLMAREGYDATQARWDINLSFDDSNLIYGGEDKPGWWKDSKATYKKPDTWYMEPKFYILNGVQKPTSELRDKGIFWNGFKGEHFVFRNEIRKRADINAQPNAQIDSPVPVRVN